MSDIPRASGGLAQPLAVTGMRRDEAAHSTPSRADDDIEADIELVVGEARPNALLEGPDVDLADLLASFWAHFCPPVAMWSADAWPACGTLVIAHVERLDAILQQRLVSWVDEHRQVQVISTSTGDLFSLVGAGEFSSDLFYRLNVVRVVVCPRAARSARVDASESI